MFVHYDELLIFLELAVAHYEKTAPTVSTYCDGLYQRINDDLNRVCLSELGAVEQLRETEVWMQPPLAANHVDQFLDRLIKSKG